MLERDRGVRSGTPRAHWGPVRLRSMEAITGTEGPQTPTASSGSCKNAAPLGRPKLLSYEGEEGKVSSFTFSSMLFFCLLLGTNTEPYFNSDHTFQI